VGGRETTKSWLTPLAAAGLVVVIAGAVAVTLASGDVATALVPLVVGLLVAFIAYSRWRLVPHPERQAAQPRGAR
jgi:cell division protein FtsW (lipid II flippase)